MALSDVSATQIRESNGVYLLGSLLIPKEKSSEEEKTLTLLQASAFRALRFLFSVERNRRLFKRWVRSAMPHVLSTGLCPLTPPPHSS